ncbi:DUF7002 family protein [Methylocella sp. CPCC 101449]|uniref:DUF7002 family protein n=1 Tax=Methylocella sp. CPCC 101449 TaxID=2987531 RepID=UPI0028906533|nr:hypothetical protein [Methylocella sp. CPCC 101449]MDT2023301.1 hypothetical protein [Methylocella sp. CPCC 101449]
MTSAELAELISDCPQIYHMAERGAWDGIKRHGLMSTCALLDLFKIDGQSKIQISKMHRPAIVEISDEDAGLARIRDQIPMSDAGLRRALPADITPADWYLRLNKMVFFWMSKERLLRLTNAKAYRTSEHEVLVLDTRKFIDAFFEKIWLCAINSGCTKPFPHPRDFEAFKRIPDYDYALWRRRRPRGERVVELCVDNVVPDVERFLLDGFVIRGEERLRAL